MFQALTLYHVYIFPLVPQLNIPQKTRIAIIIYFKSIYNLRIISTNSLDEIFTSTNLMLFDHVGNKYT